MAQKLCSFWECRQKNARLKTMVCSELFLRLERAGLVTLPPYERTSGWPPASHSDPDAFSRPDAYHGFSSGVGPPQNSHGPQLGRWAAGIASLDGALFTGTKISISLPRIPAFLSSFGSKLLTWLLIFSGEGLASFPPIGKGSILTPCWRPSWIPPASKEPATRRPIGSRWVPPRAEANGTALTRNTCPLR